MTMLDPITGQKQESFLLPEASGIDKEEVIKDRRTTDALFLRQKNSPDEPTVDLYNRTMVDIDQQGAGTVAADELVKYKAAKQRDVYQNILDSTFDDPDVVARNQEILQDVDVFTYQYDEPSGIQQAVTDNPIDLRTIKADRQANMGYAYSLMEEKGADDGTLDTAWNYITLLGTDAYKDLVDFTGETFNGIDAFERESKLFRQLSPEMQEAVIPNLVDKLYEAYDGNTVKATMALGMFMEGNTTGSNLLFAMFDAAGIFDVAKLSAGAFIAVKARQAWKASRSAARNADSADDINAAANLQVVASSDEGAKAVGGTKMDAARSADATPRSAIDDGTSVDNIAGEIDKVMQSSTKAFLEEEMPVFGGRPTMAFKAALREEQLLSVATGEVSSKGFKRVLQEDATRELLKDGPVRDSVIRAAINNNEVPANMQARFDVLVEKEIAKLREQTTKAKTAAQNKALKAEAAAARDAAVPSVKVLREEMEAVAKSVIKPTINTETEIELATARAYTRLKTELREAGTAANGITPIAADNHSVTYRINTTSGQFDRTVRFNREDLRALETNADPSVRSYWQEHFGWAFSPEHTLERVASNLVADTTFAGQQSANIKNNMTKLWQGTEKGLSRDETFQVNALLQYGDEVGEALGKEEFSIAELRSGALKTHAGSWALSDAQISSYLQKREFFRTLHRLRSTQLRETMEYDGFTMLKYTSDKGVPQQMIGRRLGHLDAEKTHATSIVHINNGKKTVVSDAYVTENKAVLKEEGYELVHMFEEHAKDVSYALVKSGEKWGRLPEKLIHYQQGYVPRIYRKGYYFARNMKTQNKGIMYAFETRADAEKWAAAANTTGEKVSVFSDKEFSKNQLLVQEANAFGGLITGSRKKNNPMVMKGETPERMVRMDVGDAADRYLNNISSIMPLNEYREAQINRWKMDINALAKQYKRQGLGKSNDFNLDAKSIDLPEDVLKPMLEVREYIKATMRMNTQEERVFENMMLGLANRMHGKSWSDRALVKSTRNKILMNSDARLTDYIKGQSFNLMMGVWNVRQLPMQMQNASLAIGMHPIHGLAAVGDMLTMRFLMSFPEDLMEAAAKRLGASDDIVEGIASYRASGLQAAISRQGDYGAHATGNSASTLGLAHIAAASGRMFFNEGENIARLTSFNIARRKYIKANPDKYLDTEVISKDAVRMQMNLQTENAAPWQKMPVVNLGTQFFQVIAKFMENVAPRFMGGGTRWTPAEKAGAIASQLVLYGVVGVPVVEESLKGLAALYGMTVTAFIEEYPTASKAISEGFTGAIMELAGAEHLQPSTSFSLLAGLGDNVLLNTMIGMSEVLNGGYADETFIETILGASDTTIGRTYNAVDSVLDNIKAFVQIPSADVGGVAVRDSLDDIAAMASSWNYYRKLRMLRRFGDIRGPDGRVLVSESELGPVSIADQLGILMGVQFREETTMYKTQDFVKATKEDKRRAGKEIREAMVELSNFGNKTLYDAKIFGLLSDYSKTEGKAMLEKELGNIMTDQSKSGKVQREALKLALEGNRILPTATIQGMK